MTSKDDKPGDHSGLRRRADDLACDERAQPENGPEVPSPDSAQRTLHELRVHQIELDLQNEELRRAQAELDAVRARYVDLYDLAPVGYITVNEQGLLLEANLTAATLLGAARGSLLGQPISRYIYKEDQDIHYLHRERMLATGQPQGYELRMVRSDGTVFCAHLETATAQNPDGAPVCRVVLSDITEHKRDEEMTRATTQRLELALRAAKAGTWDWDVVTSHLEWSPQLFDLFGLDPRTTAASFDAWRAVLHPEDLESAESRIAEALQQRKTLNSDYRVVLPDGQVRWINAVGEGVYDNLGHAVRMAGVCLDITERKRAEEALRQSEGMFRSITESAFDMIALVDLSCTYLYCNPSYLSTLGYAPAELIGRNGFALIHPDDSEPAMRLFREGLADGRLSAQASLRLVCQDGTVKWVDHRFTLLASKEGAPPRILVMAHDITQRIRAEEALERSHAQLLQSQKMEAVGRLAGGVAHDFNNILQALLSQATVLRLRVNSPELNKRVEEIEALVKRGAALTRQLLLFSRREVAKKECLDLGEMTSSASTLLRRLIPENVRLAIEIAPERLWVHGDDGQLQQVVMNLALNARDAMQAGGTMTLRTGSLEGEALIEVTDTGHGMDEETRAHLFEPFFTTKDKYRGSGLGLSVVHGIVEQHGGRIEVESAPGQGTRFRVILPMVVPPAAIAAQELSSVAELPPGHGERVLLVEDEDGARRGLAESLEMLGYVVTAMASGEDAGEIPTESAPDLLLTDLLLPGITGSDLAAALRARWPGLKVLLMSGYTDDEIVRHGVKDGAIRFLQKPFDMHRLARELRTALEDRTAIPPR